MKRSITIIMFLLISVTLSAQVRKVLIQNSRAIDDPVFNENLFFLKDFINCRISFNDGSVYSAKANISSVAQALVVIGEKGDTVGVSRERDIIAFSGGGITAFKVNGIYHQILSMSVDVSLGKTRRLDIRDRRATGAYGGSTHTSSVDQVSYFDSDGVANLMSLINNEWASGSIFEMEYEYEEDLFLISKGKRSVPTKKNFEKLFPKQKNEIAAFMKENNVTLSKKDEIIGLFKYLIGE